MPPYLLRLFWWTIPAPRLCTADPKWDRSARKHASHFGDWSMTNRPPILAVDNILGLLLYCGNSTLSTIGFAIRNSLNLNYKS